MTITQPNKAISTKQSAIEQVGTRYPHERILNNIREFLDVSDPNDTIDQIEYLHKLFNEQPDHILHSDPESVHIIARNVQAVGWLIRDLRDYQESPGWKWVRYMKDERIKLQSYLRRFIQVSDEHAGNWIEYLFTEYLLTDECDQASRKDRYNLRVNTNAASELCRQVYNYHKAGVL